MAAALSHVTYIGGIKHVKKPHPYHFSKKKKKKKWVKGDSLCSILLVGSEIQFLEGSCSMYKALPIPPQKWGFIQMYNPHVHARTGGN